MRAFLTMKGIGVIIALTLGLCQDGACTVQPIAKSGIQQLLQKSPDPVLPYRNGYTSYQPFGYFPQPLQYQGYVTDQAALPVAAFPAAPVAFASRSVVPVLTPVTTATAPLPASVSPFRFGYTNYQPFGPYQRYVPVYRPQTLQYQGYSVAAPASTTVTTAPTPPCPSCPTPVPPPTCPAPVPPPTCPAPLPPPVCPAPVPTPPPTTPVPPTCPEDPYVIEAKQRIMDFDNWMCSNMTDADGVIQACVLTGTGPITTPASPGTRCDWLMPVFCDPTLNQVAATMAITPPSPTPPVDYTLIPNQGYFKFHPEKLNYDDATAVCASEGAVLASPLTVPDYDPLVAMFLNAPPTDINGFFIQYTDNRNSMDYDFATMQRLCTMHIIAWQNIYINYDNENCTVLGYFGLDLAQDIPCGWVQPFMCQIPLPDRYKLAPCG